MTRQIEDLIEVEGEQRLLRGCPLEDYWTASRKRRPEFPPIGTNCFRGYRAVWLVKGNQLFLTSVGACSEVDEYEPGRTTISMFINEYLPVVFPEHEEPVSASWVTGEFYTETTDKTKAEMLTFERGRLVSRQSCKPFDPYHEHRKRMAEIMKEMERRRMH